MKARLHRISVLTLALAITAVSPGQGDRDLILERRTEEARQALLNRDFARAEKLCLVVFQGAKSNHEPIVAMRIYAEARFRQGGYKDALDYLHRSVRPNTDGKLDLVKSISALNLGYPGGATFMGSLARDQKSVVGLKIDPKAVPEMNESSESQLACAWFMLAAQESGVQSLEDANKAEKYAKGNVAVDWLQGVRLFELGKYKEAKAEFELVAASSFKDMAQRAKIRIRDADLQIRLKDGS